MSLEKLEQLFGTLIEAMHQLQSENVRMKEEISHLQERLKALGSEEDRNKAGLKKLAYLENTQQKMESEKAAIRTKVENILTDLEKIDWI